MYRNIRHFAPALSVALALAVSAGADAAISTFDGPVTSASELYFGTGNTNRGFTVDQNSVAGLELGLRAHVRYPEPMDTPAAIMNQGNGVYGSFEAQGYNPGSPGTPGGTRASWNFDFSINSNYNGNGSTLAISDAALSYQLIIDYDPSPGTSSVVTFDPLLLPDNAFGDNTTEFVSFAGSNVAQNSGNLDFYNELGPFAFDPNVSGIYTITLRALNANNAIVGSVEIDVLVGDQAPVPEPATLTLWGLGALGCAVGAYRRKRAG